MVPVFVTLVGMTLMTPMRSLASSVIRPDSLEMALGIQIAYTELMVFLSSHQLRQAKHACPHVQTVITVRVTSAMHVFLLAKLETKEINTDA